MKLVLATPGKATVRGTQERLSVQDLIAESNLTRQDLHLIFELAADVKAAPRAYNRALQGKQLAMIFEKPSLRTRTTFEVGMTSMGGFALYLDHANQHLGHREAIKDIARNLERWVDGIMARTFSHASIVELAENASIPVINGLSDLLHPCQALADFFTLEEKFGRLRGLKLAYVGDGNNVCHSLMVAGAKLGVSIHAATPPGFEPQAEIVEGARTFARQTGARISISHDPYEAVSGASAVYTDVWASMGHEQETGDRTHVFAPYQVNETLMTAANPGVVFMHCLPAHRGLEVADAVIDSSCSIVFDQAENRLHVQKALLILLLGAGRT
jgi:ornithine carbamoyltransferase